MTEGLESAQPPSSERDFVSGGPTARTASVPRLGALAGATSALMSVNHHLRARITGADARSWFEDVSLAGALRMGIPVAVGIAWGYVLPWLVLVIVRRRLHREAVVSLACLLAPQPGRWGDDRDGGGGQVEETEVERRVRLRGGRGLEGRALAELMGTDLARGEVGESV
jgi:hypothetical protein